MILRFKPNSWRLVWLCCSQPTMHLSMTYGGISEIYWLVIGTHHQPIVNDSGIIDPWSEVSERTNIVLVCLCHWSICIIQVIFWYFIDARNVIWDISYWSVKAGIEN